MATLQEFAGLDDDAGIYKLVGPVLLKQEKTEAVMAVDGRLEFIEGEMSVGFPGTYIPYLSKYRFWKHTRGRGDGTGAIVILTVLQKESREADCRYSREE